MRGTMQPQPLSILSLMEHARRVHPDSEVVAYDGSGYETATFEQLAARAERLARALAGLGVAAGDVVGIYAWNTFEYLEAYLAVPAMGAALNTLNIRLHGEHLRHVMEQAGTAVVIVDESLLDQFLEATSGLTSLRTVVVIGVPDSSTSGGPSIVGYEEVDANQPSPLRTVDENDAAMVCFTSGTTGLPKGVAYSHRSIWLHTMMLSSANLYGLTEADRLLITVPMFHAMGMGVPYVGLMTGADIILPGRYLQPRPLAEIIAAQRPTFASAVPVIWNDILRHGEEQDIDLTSLRVLACGGSSVPASFIDRFQRQLGVRIVQGWGMTEANPVGAVNVGPSVRARAEEADTWRERSGRMLPGVEMRIVDDEGNELPWDGTSAGELEVRGPWITGSYIGDDAPQSFHDGWLRTGDVAVLYRNGFLKLVDRIKDVVKSGGEWISSIELEAALATHGGVRESCIIAVPDERWQERPLAVVATDENVDFADLRGHLQSQVARFWVPELWARLDELPRTGVGKIDKRAVRALVDQQAVDVVRVEG